MHTDPAAIRRVSWTTVLLLAFAITAIVLLRMIAASSDVGQTPQLAEIGFTTTPISTDGRISEDDAWASVVREYGKAFDGGLRQASIVHADDSPTFVQDRDVWVFQITGLAIDDGIPIIAVAKSTPYVYTRAFVFVDATTGEWLTTVLR